MSLSPVERENGVCATGDIAGDLIEMQLYGLGISICHSSGCTGSTCRAYGAK